MGCYGGRWGQITKSVGLGWTGLVSPFSPISPHFSPFSPIFPWELSPIHPPHSLAANQNHVFGLFSPKIPHFSFKHLKFLTIPPIFPHFS